MTGKGDCVRCPGRLDGQLYAERWSPDRGCVPGFAAEGANNRLIENHSAGRQHTQKSGKIGEGRPMSRGWRTAELAGNRGWPAVTFSIPRCVWTS